MSYDKILVPYDGSPFAKRAFDRALDIAEAKNSKITALYVIKEEYPPIVGFSKAYAKIMKARQKEAKTLMAKLESVAKKRKIQVISKIKRGDSIVKEITDFLKSNKFDLVIIGSHGRTGFKKLMLGSVSSGVVNNSKNPVMVVK